MIAMLYKKLILFLTLAITIIPLTGLASTMLVWGDSLSSAYNFRVDQGWVALLQARLQARSGDSWRVINASISGESANGGLSRLPAALTQHQPDILILGLGSNEGLRGQSLRGLKSNLERMVKLAKDSGAKVLLLGNRIPPNYGVRYTDGFALVYQDISSTEEIPMVPFLLDGVATNLNLMQADGLHPTPAAQPRLLQNVWPYLKPML
jgi:acyl-CoA thioesterase-1